MKSYEIWISRFQERAAQANITVVRPDSHSPAEVGAQKASLSHKELSLMQLLIYLYSPQTNILE